MSRFLLLAVLLAPSLAAARYDPSTDRAALRQNATASHSTIVDATGLSLEPEKAAAIATGLDEGLRLAGLAAAAAKSLDAAAKSRSEEIKKGADALDKKIKDRSGPVAAERLRADAGVSELAEDKKKIEKLPEEEQKKFAPRVTKAAAQLAAAVDALYPAENAVRDMGQRALEMKAARRQGERALAEVSPGAADVLARVPGLTAPATAVKEAVAAIGPEPRDAARAKARQKIELLRGESLLAFQAADRTCNRVDDFRRASSDYDDASDAFEKAVPAATPAGAKSFLDEAEKTLALIRELLKKP